MADRVYPAAKPNPPPPTAGAGAAAKPQLYNPNRPRPAYRPQPRQSKRRCSCRRICCLCFIYALIAVLSLLLTAAVAGMLFYVLYHPKHPTFSVSSVRISAFNLSTPSDPSSAAFSHLQSNLDFTLSAKNPNRNLITFLYDPFTVTVSSSGGLFVGNASLPAFEHVPGNTTIARGAAAGDPKHDLDSDSVSKLRSDLSKKGGFPVSIQLDTKVEVKMGKLKSKKVGIRVSCDGIRGSPPKKKKGGKKVTPAVASVAGAKCKVDLHIKIWRFTF